MALIFSWFLIWPNYLVTWLPPKSGLLSCRVLLPGTPCPLQADVVHTWLEGMISGLVDCIFSPALLHHACKDKMK